MTRLWHVTISTVSRETAFRTERERRAAVRRLVGIAGDSLALFGLVDDHGHNILRNDRTGAGRIAQRLNCSLATRGLRFEASDIRPVNGRLHLRTLVRYIFTQPEHHQLPLHPALWEGSCFQDLVGARWLPGLHLCLHEELPRLSLDEVTDLVGLPRAAIVPADPEAIHETGLVRIAAAAAVAVGAGSLRGQRTETIVARRVAVHLARAVGFSRREICAALGWPKRTVSRYATTDVAPAALRAARIRIALERAVAMQTPRRADEASASRRFHDRCPPQQGQRPTGAPSLSPPTSWQPRLDPGPQNGPTRPR